MAREAARKTAGKPLTRKAAGAAPRRPAATPKKKARKPAPASAEVDTRLRTLKEVTDALRAEGDRLAQLVAEMPRASDFQPLADHLYEFAQGGSVRALQEVGDMLLAVHGRFEDSMLRLPLPEDYEPLAQPLLQFARLSPGVTGSLDEVLRLTGSLLPAVGALQADVALLRESHEALAAAVTEAAASADHGALTAPLREFVRVSPALVDSLRALPLLAAPLEAAAAHLASSTARALGAEEREALARDVSEARSAILEAVATLPREGDYAAVAAQLRELATVSPSLMEWLQDVPAVGTPLAGSVGALLQAARRLADVEDRLRSGASPGRSVLTPPRPTP